jgi:hypothetical protein
MGMAAKIQVTRSLLQDHLPTLPNASSPSKTSSLETDPILQAKRQVADDRLVGIVGRAAEKARQQLLLLRKKGWDLSRAIQQISFRLLAVEVMSW